MGANTKMNLSNNELVDKCLEKTVALNKWELNFLEDLRVDIGRNAIITPGQRGKLIEIYESIF